VAWQDFRTLSTYDIYAERFERTGRLGSPEPEVAWIRDLPGEQGGHVRINWSRSYVDSLPGLAIGSYGIWRQVSASFATSAIARGARMVTGAAATEPNPGIFRTERLASQTIWWEGVGSIPARGEPWYTFVAETFRDSVASGNPYTTFMVDAHGAFTPLLWSSLADSGYSVDNLPPGIPASFSGQYAAGATTLTWSANAEHDLCTYRLHRGATAGFVPGPGNLIATPTGTQWVDVAPSGSFYKLSAVDVHGNESGYALTSSTSTDVIPRMPLTLALAPPQPNPTRGATSFRLALPFETRASLAIFDLSGRRIRSLLEGREAAGERSVSWDLRDDRGEAVPNGIYLARLEASGLTIVRRVIALP
jgi:hypothetical protein